MVTQKPTRSGSIDISKAVTDAKLDVKSSDQAFADAAEALLADKDPDSDKRDVLIKVLKVQAQLDAELKKPSAPEQREVFDAVQATLVADVQMMVQAEDA
jgi:hypothetical protein